MLDRLNVKDTREKASIYVCNALKPERNETQSI